MHPFLDVSKLTDEEITEKLGRAYIYMNAQVALGHNPTVYSIKEIIQSLEEERHKRLMQHSDDEYKRKFPKANDPIEIGKLED